jgi:hypothetical protein
MAEVITALGSGLSSSQTSELVSRFGKLYFSFFLFLLVWFILTAIIMLVMANKSSKKGQIMSIFIVSTLILLGVLLIGYFNLESLLTWFNI